MQTVYFGDVEKRVEIAKGLCKAFNNLYGETGKMPYLDDSKIEKSIRKTTAKFYGEQSKYKGNGNLK